MKKDDIIICRCEDITLKEIEDLLKEGYTTIDEIKRVSRSGMGPCQGRTCTPLLVKMIASHRGIDPSKVKIPTQRPPIKPVKMGTILASLGSTPEGGSELSEEES